MSEERAIVVGGGVAGLAAAYAIGAHQPVVLLEKQAEVGGNLRSERVDGFLLEWGPHALLMEGFAELFDRLGLDEHVVLAEPAAHLRFIVRGGVPHVVPVSPGKVLTSSLLSPLARLRLLAEAFVPRGKPAHDESVDAFLRRRFGREAAEIVGDAIIGGVFAGDPRTLSMRSCFPRLAQLESKHRSILLGVANHPKALRRGPLVSFREGMAELAKAFAARIQGSIRTGADVVRVDHAPPGRWRVATSRGEEQLTSRLVLACPAWEAARLLGSTAPELSTLLAGIASVPIAVVHLGFATEDLGSPPKGFGILVPSSEGAAVLGMIAASNVFPHRAPEGHTLVTAMMGGARAPKTLDDSDDKIVEQALAGLNRLIAPKAPPKLARVIRHPHAIPQYAIGHAQRLAAIDEHLRALPGLALAGNSYRGVSVGAAVEDALKLA